MEDGGAYYKGIHNIDASASAGNFLLIGDNSNGAEFNIDKNEVRNILGSNKITSISHFPGLYFKSIGSTEIGMVHYYGSDVNNPNIEYTLFTGDGKNACAPGYYPEGTVMLAGGTYSITILDTPGATCEITHVEFYKRGVLFDTIRKEDIIDYHGVFGYSYDDGAFSTDTHFEAKVYYVDSYGIVGVVDIHDDYKFVIPNYYGILDSENDITIAKLSTLDVVALPTREFTWTGITTRSQIPCYCYPTSMKPLESIKDGNGYEMISSFSRVIAKVNSKDNYYVYYFTGGTTVDDFTFIFK